MNKSNFQLLAEELEEEILELSKELKIKKQLLEASPSPPPPKVDFPDFYDPSTPNKGGYAGLAVGPAANTAAVVLNPALISATKGKILPDVDPRVVKYKPYYSNNLATMMGLGLDMNTFNRAKEFINQYSSKDGALSTGVTEKDDPEESVALDWKRLNNAVSNFTGQKTKELLSKNYLFKGPANSNYEQGLSDKYQVFVPGKKARKIADETANYILGKPNKSKGKNVEEMVRKLSSNQMNRFSSTWTQNSDQSGKINIKK